MDNNYNQQTNGNPYQQQGNPYQQGNVYQQQGNPYQQQGNPYQQQGSPYQQQGNPYQQGMPYMDNGYGNNGGNVNAEPQKAPNIFQQFVLAFVPTKYDRLAKVKTGSMIGFVTLLVFIASVLTFISVIVSLASLNVEEWVYQLPKFTIADGHLSIEEAFVFDEGSAYVYVTDDVDEFSTVDASELAEEGYHDIILVGRDRILVVQNTGYLNWQYIDFGVFGPNVQIDREWIVSTMVPLMKGLVVATYFIVFLTGALGYFLGAAVYLLFALIIASVMKKNLEAGALFRAAVYSKVLMFVVATILDLLPFVGFSVPFLLRVAVTLVFMGFAIAKLPDNRPVYTAPMMGPGQGGQGWQ